MRFKSNDEDEHDDRDRKKRKAQFVKVPKEKVAGQQRLRMKLACVGAFAEDVRAKEDAKRPRVAQEVIDAKDTAEPQISKSA